MVIDGKRYPRDQISANTGALLQVIYDQTGMIFNPEDRAKVQQGILETILAYDRWAWQHMNPDMFIQHGFLKKTEKTVVTLEPNF